MNDAEPLSPIRAGWRLTTTAPGDGVARRHLPQAVVGKPWRTSFLDISMQLLAFFVLLQTLSVPNPERRQAVLASLEKTFDRPPIGEIANAASQEGAVVGATLARRLATVFANYIPLEQVEVSRRGDTLIFALPQASLFLPGDNRPMPRVEPLIGDIATALAEAPAGWRFDLDALVGGREAPDGEAAMRAAALARALAAAGAPATSLAAGIASDEPARVRLLFHVRSADAPVVTFGEAPPAGAAPRP
ncbi:MAG: hypothetical protein OHK0024_36250 [Thalassobaculales bacterium]